VVLELSRLSDNTLPVVIKGEEEYEVDKILNKKKVRGKDRYLV